MKMTDKSPIKFWSMESAIKQIEKCKYECEGGPLANNDAWVWLAKVAEIGPKFWPGQGVYFEVEAEAAGVKLRQWVFFYIVGCSMSSTTEGRTWEYSLSYDPPRPWHYGTVQFTNVKSEKLRLEKPELAAA